MELYELRNDTCFLSVMSQNLTDYVTIPSLAFGMLRSWARDDDLSVVTLASTCVRPYVPENRKRHCAANCDRVTVLP